MGNEGVDGEFVFEDIEKIVLLELFDIPHSGFIPFHIAKAFGCSRQNINQKVNAAKIVVEDRLFHAVDDDEDEIDALTDEYFDPDKGVTAENYAALNSNLKRW